MKIQLALLVFTFWLTMPFSSSYATEGAREVSIFVDPRFSSWELPDEPPMNDRIAVLNLLESIPIFCRDETNAEDIVPTWESFERGAAELDLRSDLATTLASLMMTERTISMTSMQFAIEAMVRMQSSEADRWLATVYRAAPILADRFIEKDVGTADRPSWQKYFRTKIRLEIEGAADRWQNNALKRELKRQRDPNR